MTDQQITALEAQLADHGRQAIKQGSKSFALASTLFGRQMQHDVQMLYAWCRYCDDVIDGQTLGEDAPDAALSAEEQAARLHFLKEKTAQAFAGEVTNIPAFDGFSIVARRHHLPVIYAQDLLDGFAMDVARHVYEREGDLMQYCYGVAGAVGIMMAIVMGVDPEDQATLDRACDLGLAFQLTNICRDLIDDARAGRVYVDAASLEAAGLGGDSDAVLDSTNRDALYRLAQEKLAVADRYYDSALQGVPQLPFRAGIAVCAARRIYRAIGRKILRGGPRIWDTRVFISNQKKIGLAMAGAGDVLAIKAGAQQQRPRDAGLWQRPRHA